MQACSYIFLGWLHIDAGIDGQARDFYRRQLKDWTGSAEIERMIPKGVAIYGRLWGWTLARAHARSGERIAIAAYLGRSPQRSAPAKSPPKPASDRGVHRNLETPRRREAV